MPKEPQSYGSEGDWTSGDVGQEVNRQDSRAGENVRQQEHSDPHQGGETPEHQKADDSMVLESCDVFDTGDEGAKKVTDLPGGARRNGFFKDRDYNR